MPARALPSATTGTCLCLLVLAAGQARAEDEPAASSASAGATVATAGHSHQGQLGISLRSAVGMRAIVPYDDTDYCGALDASTSSGNAAVCTGRAPLSLDLELGYGLTRRMEALVELRIGVEADFGASSQAMGGPRVFHMAPGARFFFSEADNLKLFSTAQLVLDFSGYEDAAGGARGADYGVRNLNGVWLDLGRAYGIYAYLGETATIARWMRFELEAGIGVQARYP